MQLTTWCCPQPLPRHPPSHCLILLLPPSSRGASPWITPGAAIHQVLVMGPEHSEHFAESPHRPLTSTALAVLGDTPGDTSCRQSVWAEPRVPPSPALLGFSETLALGSGAKLINM